MMPCFAIGDRPLEQFARLGSKVVPNEVLSRTILENSAIFVTFANVCSQSVCPMLWPNLWLEGSVRCIGVEAGGPLHRATHDGGCRFCFLSTDRTAALVKDQAL